MSVILIADASGQNYLNAVTIKSWGAYNASQGGYFANESTGKIYSDGHFVDDPMQQGKSLADYLPKDGFYHPNGYYIGMSSSSLSTARAAYPWAVFQPSPDMQAYIDAGIPNTGQVQIFASPSQVTPSAGANGSISPNAPQLVSRQGSIDLVATPNSGYTLDAWYVDGGKQSTTSTNVTLSNITTNRTVQVTFKPIPATYTIYPSATGNGSISPNTATQVIGGGSLGLTAVPNSGMAVDQWQVDGTTVQNGGTSYTLSNITANHTVSVSFRTITYTLTPSAGAHGSISPNTVQTVNSGGSFTFNAAPKSGWAVDQWYINGGVQAGIAGQSSANITNITGDLAVQVTFKSSMPGLTPLLSAGDFIIAVDIDGNSAYPNSNPFIESPANGIDGTTSTKYLNSGRDNAGFIVTPAGGAAILTAFELWTGNDYVERDPIGYKLYGTNANILSTDNGKGISEPWIYITQGTFFSTPSSRQASYGTISFANSVPYRSYKWVVTGVRTPSAVNEMQFSEIQFYGRFTGGGDLNGDGKADLVFQNNAGQIYAWFLDGTGNTVDPATGAGRAGANSIYGGSLGDWRLAARADVNGDGNVDLIFQNNAGQIYAWFLDGTGNTVDPATGAGRSAAQYLYASGLGDWRIVACADVNSDGKADLIFQNTAGQLYVWFLDGTGNTVNPATGAGRSGAQYLYASGLSDWRIVACADVNGDGKADLIFQDTTGQIYAWFLDGTGNPVDPATGAGRAGANSIYGSGLGDWRIVACADVNSDGKVDLIFQNTAGQLYVWFLDGTGNTVNPATGAGRTGAGFLYGSGLGDWRLH